MDWNHHIATAKRLIDKFGKGMSVCTISGSYSATSDSISATIATYDSRGVITNPVVKSDEGEYSRSNKMRLLLAASGLPSNLDETNFKIVSGADTWFPKSTRSIKPGGTPILFVVDLK